MGVNINDIISTYNLGVFYLKELEEFKNSLGSNEQQLNGKECATNNIKAHPI